MYRIRYCCLSHVGKLRPVNQDNFICDGQFLDQGKDSSFISLKGVADNRQKPLFGVFDGMGGEYRGEVAAAIAAKNARDFSAQSRFSYELLSLCRRANDEICRYYQSRQLPSMGTTAAMLLPHRHSVTLCNIGDSKIFVLSGGVLKQLSEDHVCHVGLPGKAPLSQNLGIPREEMRIEPYVTELTYKNGNLYLICSDGLTDMVSVDEIRQTLENTAFDRAAETLLQLALDAGGRDNITLLLLRTEKRGLLAGF